jgi:hypothetical protein
MKRAQVREALEQVPIDQILGVKGKLTHKQKTFARLVAQGETGANSYRKAYDVTTKRAKTAGNAASDLKKHSGIAREIEAIRLAESARAYHTPEHLRSLVIHSLVKVITDPESKAGQITAAAKVLGTVTEVAAFTERKQITTITSSDQARTQLLDKLRTLVHGNATDVAVKDADSLLAELDPPPLAIDQAAEDDLPPPKMPTRSPSSDLHSIPLEVSPEKLDGGTSFEDSDLESELQEDPPSSFQVK